MARHARKTASSFTKLAASTVALGSATAVLAPTASAAPDSDWDRLAQCESGGNWASNTGNGYYGGLQFSSATWNAHGGQQFAAFAHQTGRAEQIIIAERVLASQGWGAWPSCSAQLGLNSAPTPREGGVAPAAPAPAAPVGSVDLNSVVNGVKSQLEQYNILIPNEINSLVQNYQDSFNNLIRF
ncbi:Resuscitation-promoting factor Rpf1 [Corynebacterium sp. sy017]|uniref:transglycosylase family protein n=1 Tax=unclassified Corynebacterium TaxID=2624378 RepID=UPI00118587FA|nr:MULTISPECIES: transglycosylase family protein [unclassified Corynebacterium]MBP3088790.1 Resuscitation-promoting factor Rpf1 [Corynebacterium sp. sy017]QDZ42183.1 transglycosylase family protein [Corynebacterium sp. sy039]TSD91133.1 Resuscitation-promoting factor Rpf1 [Corynebacterium sp. SY003]